VGQETIEPRETLVSAGETVNEGDRHALQSRRRRLFWWDVRFVQPARSRKETWHVYCVAGASDETRQELMAVLRSYEPPTAGSVTTPKGPPAEG